MKKGRYIDLNEADRRMNSGIITYADIEAKFTEVVRNFIGRGYQICTETMRGSQGELGKVDLYHPHDIKRVVRILLDRTAEGGVVLSVMDFKEWDGRDSLWNGKGNSITFVTYHNITGDFIDRRNAKFITGQEKYESICQKQRSRWADKYGCGDGIEREIEISDAQKKSILKIARQRKGYKTVTASDIQKICRYENFYAIKFCRKHDILIHMEATQ